MGGHLALDFANTVDGEPGGETGVEYLWGYGGLVAWGHHVGLLTEDEVSLLLDGAAPRPEEAEAVHARALELRGGIQDVFRAVAEGVRPASGDLESLRRAEGEAVSHARLEPGDAGFRWEWPDVGDLSKPLWPVAHAAIGLLTSGRLDRVKRCAGCHWLYVDVSRNRSRRWCTMEVCGTNEKMRRYVAKRAARRSSA